MKGKKFAACLPHLAPLELSLEGFTQEHVDDVLLGDGDHHHLLFGIIPRSRILGDLKERGLQALLEERGYADFQVEMERLSPFEEGLSLSARHPGLATRASLMELRAHWGTLRLPNPTPGKECRALVWDWIELTDPVAKFSPSRPPLPGQTAPGLSLFRPLAELVCGYVADTQAQALVAVPQYYHNAVLYVTEPGLRFRFLDPLRHGQLLAQMRDLNRLGLAQASWGFEERRIESLAPDSPPEQWCPHSWTPAELVLGLCREVRNYLQEPGDLVSQGESYRFRLHN